jgi:hypothetical protein
MKQIDSAHMVVDLCDGSEVKGAVSIDEDTGDVTVARKTYDEQIVTTITRLLNGWKVVRRR